MSTGQPPYIFDHVDRRYARIITKLRRATRFVDLVTIITEEVQALEDATTAAIIERYLDVAVGANLDQYGLLVGERRDGLNDIEYRAFIGARILSNLSEGTIDEMTAILAIIGRATSAVQYIPLYPAGMQFGYVTAEPPASDARAARIVTQMTEVAPAGVEVAFIVEATEDYFGFDDDPEAFGFDEGEFARAL